MLTPAGLDVSVFERQARITGLITRGDLLTAIGICEEARASAPADPWLAMIYSVVLHKLGDQAAAIDAARVAIELGSDDQLTYGVLGYAHRALGRHEEAGAALLEAYKRAPQNLQYAAAAITEAASVNLDEAERIYQAVKAVTDSPDIDTAWGLAAFSHGRRTNLPPGLVPIQLSSTPAWMARNSLDLDVSGPPEAIPVQDPEMIGGPYTVPVNAVIQSYPPYVATLPNALALSKSHLVATRDGVALYDTAVDPQYGRFFAFADPAIRAREGDHVLLDVRSLTSHSMDAAISLLGAASEHYGHWVPEFLFRLVHLVQRPGFEALPILIDAGMPISHREFLQRVVPNTVIEVPAHAAIRCAQLVVIGPSTFFPVHLTPDSEVPLQAIGPFSPASLRFLRERVLATMPPVARSDRKIYLSRRASTWRLLTNELDVASLLHDHGFEIVFPQDLTFEQQVRLFQESAAIVGANGSAWINLIFARPDVKALVLSQPEFTSFNGLVGPMRALGYDLLFAAGDEHHPGEKHASYAMSLDRLREGLARLGL